MSVLLCLVIAPESALASRAGSLRTEWSGVGGTHADFNGDGFADAAIAEVFAGVGGAVRVMYGSVDGLTSKGSQYWTEDDLGGEAHRWDYFGGSLATGDFDGDHFTDLAIGIPQAELEPPFGDEGSDRGLLRIVYGSARGLTKARSQLWNYGRMTGDADLGRRFGSALAAGNFGKGRQDDLAVGGANGEPVAVLYGGAAGLASAGYQLWSQNSAGIAGKTELEDEFGSSLVAGHFAGRVYADLAIGVPGEGVAEASGAGAVNVIYGSAAGLTATGNQLWSQASPGIAGTPEAGDGFGGSLAAGSLDGKVSDALAIGVPGEGIDGRANAGAVNVVYGSSNGLRAVGNQFWSQSSRGVPGVPEANDGFGSGLAIGNFGRNVEGRAYADLAIGVPLESVGRAWEAGSVTVIYGSPSGVRGAHSRVLTQATPGVPGQPEEQDRLGTALAAANFGNDFSGRAFDDLIMGAPFEGIPPSPDGDGAIIVAYGDTGGLSTRRCEIWFALKLGHPPNDDSGGVFGAPLVA
ncbi:hypothetical protein GCM10009841_19540 [Microlunatus panaciterrae]|uniref:FG-GAP repeat-containing protein n=1 Tax=Microlunatus panaciterrae TaxID=400768 RepID=A0ABS2RNB8_9ACTN|nr:VCBS repeat-containing protein [Microlunatus panaciterrae]MBM7800511.1 hypothetical protein [Microlunatus panaciterrae]